MNNNCKFFFFFSRQFLLLQVECVVRITKHEKYDRMISWNEMNESHLAIKQFVLNSNFFSFLSIYVYSYVCFFLHCVFFSLFTEPTARAMRVCAYQLIDISDEIIVFWTWPSIRIFLCVSERAERFLMKTTASNLFFHCTLSREFQKHRPNCLWNSSMLFRMNH